MGLARPGFGATIEKPKTTGAGIHGRELPPVGRLKPSSLRPPLLGDQEQVAPLDGELVQQQQVAASESFHLQALIPGKKGIWLGPLPAQMFRCGRFQSANDEWLAARKAFHSGIQGDQRTVGFSHVAAAQRCCAVAPQNAHLLDQGQI
jgi:hypothetical protein